MQAILLYLPLISIFIYFGVSAGLVILTRFQPRFAYHWILAAFGTLISWALIQIARLGIPGEISLGVWETGIFENSPVLLLDGFSWLLGASLATLALAVVLSDVVRIKTANWKSWVGSSIMIALGIIAVMAGNQLTLVLAWAGIDLLEIMMWMVNVYDIETRQRIVMAFSIRTFAIMLTFWPGNNPNIFILAVLLRLAVLPFHLPEMEQENLRRGLGTVLRLISPIASLVFVMRIATVGIPESESNLWLAVVLIAAIFASIYWIRAKNELEGRPYWVMGMSMLALASAIRNQPVASMIWSISLVLAGGFLFLYSFRSRYLNLLAIFTVIGVSGLPFTPSWDTGRLFSAPLYSWQLLFLLPQALLFLGYVRNALRPVDEFEVPERAMWLVYPWGLLLLPSTLYIIGYWKWQEVLQLGTGYLYPAGRNMIEYWSGAGAISLVVLIYLAFRFFPKQGLEKMKNLHFTLSWHRSLTSFNWMFRQVSVLVATVSELVEGEGGILWTLLLLALIIAFFAQGGLGI
jgi:hypothetical protein